MKVWQLPSYSEKLSEPGKMAVISNDKSSVNPFKDLSGIALMERDQQSQLSWTNDENQNSYHYTVTVSFLKLVLPFQGIVRLVIKLDILTLNKEKYQILCMIRQSLL